MRKTLIILEKFIDKYELITPQERIEILRILKELTFPKFIISGKPIDVTSVPANSGSGRI